MKSRARRKVSIQKIDKGGLGENLIIKGVYLVPERKLFDNMFFIVEGNRFHTFVP